MKLQITALFVSAVVIGLFIAPEHSYEAIFLELSALVLGSYAICTAIRERK